MFRRSVIVFLLLTCALTLSTFPAKADVVDKILVIVNDEIITQGDLDRYLMPIYMQYRKLYSGEELSGKVDEARHNVLQKLLNDKLLLTEAKRRKIEVNDAEVQAKIDEIRARFGTEEEFQAALSNENMMIGNLEKMNRDKLMIDKLIHVEVRTKISVSPGEIISYYNENEDEFIEPENIKLRSILIKTGDTRSEEEALIAAKEILERLKEGGDMSLLAKEYSEGPYASNGGDMGWVAKGSLMKRIDDLVFSMKVNEISGILKTRLGFHIFKVEAKAMKQKKELGQVKDIIEKKIYNEKLEKKLRAWIDDLKRDAYIAFR